MASSSVASVKPLHAGIYARISTGDKTQDVEVQMRELRAYCDRRGWTYSEYADVCSGSEASAPA